MKKCIHCGATEKETRIIFHRGKRWLCNRHRIQIERHGIFINSRVDGNEFFVKSDHCEIQIYTSQTKLCRTKISLEDVDECKKYRWYMYSKYIGARFESSDRSSFLHHFIMGRKENMFIDHINGDKLDNRRVNLRFVTPAQNAWNQQRDRGVSFDKVNKKFCASIGKDGKTYWLGRHATYDMALRVRIEKERELYGEYSKHYE